MNSKTIVIMAGILSIMATILWLIALITANITIFLISLVLVIINAIIAFKNFNSIKEYFNSELFNGRFQEDERTDFIDSKASTATLGISVTIIIYTAVGILVLRNTYPDLVMAGYTLVIAGIFILLTHIITTKYYKHIY
jgi:hypothetical protein